MQECMGRGPKDIHTHLIGDLLVVRLQGVLTTAEQHLVKTLQAEKGRDLLKQVRIQLMEAARPIMEAMVKEITGVKVVTLHHDISTKTGEEVVLFTLAESPILREPRRNSGSDFKIIIPSVTKRKQSYCLCPLAAYNKGVGRVVAAFGSRLFNEVVG